MAGGGNDKIKLFKFIQKLYQNTGLYPSQFHHNPINAKKLFILFSLAQFFTSSAAYISFEANSMIGFGMAFFTCLTAIVSSILYLILFWEIRNILNFFEKCERFVEKRTHLTIVYKKTYENIERFTEFFAKGMVGTATFFVLPVLLYSMVNYYVLDAGKESFFLFFPAWWPFDWKTPIGYLMAWIAQCAGVAGLGVTAISFFNIVFASSYLFIVIVEDITNDVTAFNNTVGTQRDGSDRAELMEHFCDIVQLYTDAKQFINEFNEMFKYSLFSFFLWDMLSVSSLLVTLQFQLWDDDSKVFEIFVLSMLIVWPFLFNMIACEPGQRVTAQYDQFGQEFDQCEWNKLPIEMQRMYLIFLSDTQQPHNIRCYGGILCTRDTFKTITTNGFSYFMTLRRFRA